jgi:hypothetical protein
MKQVIYGFLILVGLSSLAQKTQYNTKDGYAAEGYDVVAYFSNKAAEGKKQYFFSFENVNYKFSSAANLNTFKADPARYAPQYGGWCAYAMATDGEKVSINPKTFEIRDDKLYLFYNSVFTNTFESWLKEDPEKLKRHADINWKKLDQ